jgi:uracil-DNA glycosylase family 4
MSSKTISEPSRDCPLCPRLAGFRQAQRAAFPDWHNAPVPCFGNPRARLMIVGLAPGLRGANRTGRPFTGDYAGDLLFATLKKLKLATGDYEQRPDDTLTLTGARICNSVRCVPPENKPLPLEVRQCNSFLKAEIAAMPELRVLLALGRIAHDAALTALGEKPSRFTFGHGARHEVQGLTLFDSYHCSRYNTNTGRLTAEMFETVMADAARLARA